MSVQRSLRRKFRPMAIAVLVAGLAACANGHSEQSPAAAAAVPERLAYAQLVDAAGEATGRAVLTDDGTGVDVALLVENMAPGTYAFHVHETGTCTPPAFVSAGGHFNPTGAHHGVHKGDLPNVVVGAGGTARLEAHIDGVSLARSGAMPIIDGDGAALVIHARADDGVTDPSGNAGPRIACGPIIVK